MLFRSYRFLEIHRVLFIDLVPIYEVVLLASRGAALSGKVSHSSTVEAGSFWFGRGSLGLGDICSVRLPVEPVRWSPGAGGGVHRDWLVSHPSWGVAQVVLILWWPLVGSEWWAKALPLSKGWERSWSVGCSSVCFKDVDNLSGFGGANGPSFDFVVVP